MLNDRTKLILKEIVQEYIANENADPVGSQTLSKNEKIGLSAATIRNVMADLENMGLIEHPHTSSGRIPTDMGYRLYVDTLMDTVHIPNIDLLQIVKEYKSAKTLEVETLLDKTSKLLSTLSNYAGLVLFSNLAAIKFKQIEFIKITSHTVTAIFVTESGIIRKTTIETEEDLSFETLTKINRYLTEKFKGMTIATIKKVIVEEMADEKRNYDKLLERAMSMGKKAFVEEGISEEIYVGGTVNIFDYPEFIKDIDKMKSIFSAFENKNCLINLLDKWLLLEGTNVIIGSENEIQEVKDCSLITHTYHSGNDTIGTVAILGPKRMQYSQMIALVSSTAKNLSQHLTGFRG